MASDLNGVSTPSYISAWIRNRRPAAYTLPRTYRPAPTRRAMTLPRSVSGTPEFRTAAVSTVPGSMLRRSSAPSRFRLSRSTMPSPRYAAPWIPWTEKGRTATAVGETGPAGQESRPTTPHPIAINSTPAATSPAVRMARGRTAAAVGPVVAVARAWASCAAVWNRSAGTRARAREITPSTVGGTCSRTVRTGGAGSVSRLARTACAVGPVNGGVPESIS